MKPSKLMGHQKIKHNKTMAKSGLTAQTLPNKTATVPVFYNG
jgi:hypothetical protein